MQAKAKGTFFENQIKRAAEKKAKHEKEAEERAKKIEQEKAKRRGQEAVRAIQKADVDAKLISMFDEDEDEVCLNFLVERTRIIKVCLHAAFICLWRRSKDQVRVLL
jgi:hypothetical protein